MEREDLERELARLHDASFAWALGCCRWQRDAAEEVLQSSTVALKRYLFSPQLVMRFHQELDLGEQQRRTIKDAILKAQAEFVDLEWQQQAELGKLLELLRAHPVDATGVRAQGERLLAAESRIKLLHLELLVHIKNLLTPVQQATLSRLRARLQRE